jgi:hypothetical protein
VRSTGTVGLALALVVLWARAAAPREAGDDASLAPLESIRRDPDLGRDPAAIDALARAADRLPPGRERVEARVLVAEAWLGRMKRPNDAIRELRQVVDDPWADALTASLAERELVDALVAAGRLDDGAAEAHARASILDPQFVRTIDRLVRRRFVRRGAFALLAAFGALSTIAVARAQRRGALANAVRAVRAIAPIAVAFAAFVALVGAALAARYESGTGRPFLLLGLVALPLVFATRAWSAVGSARTSARLARAALCGATLLAAAFVLLDVVSPEYLEGFGL